jgi:hypothetical protein
MNALLFRKKPLKVTAVRLTDDNLAEVAAWCGADMYPKFISINTTEGSIIALKGDWVVKEAGDHFLRVNPEVFDKTYEEFDDEVDDAEEPRRACNRGVKMAARHLHCEQEEFHSGPHTAGSGSSWVAWTDATADWSDE